MNTDSNQHPEIAVGLIVSEDGRLLLQHRDNAPGIIEPGRWGLFGGHIEPDEHASAAFLRELNEELGWRPRHFEPYTTLDIMAGEVSITSHVYAAHLDVALDELCLNEGRAMSLFPADALPSPIAAGLPALIGEFAASDAHRRVRKVWAVISVTGILVDRRGRFLLQHRDNKPDIANPGLWGSFGGEIEPFETPLDGFLREMQEELGWQPKAHAMYGSAPYTPQTGRGSERPNSHLIYVYAAAVDVPFRQLELHEGQGMSFFPVDGLPSTTVAAYKTLLKRFTREDLFRAMKSAAS